ncbi:hypothetical protein TanjilG_03601 [Lupinus angustifolius]|uniref:Pentatricopeptide repeat-containing protein n=1 Tax=Lupinus angustifolius TaxID=3871 RepID=A0A1J7GI38_LUPAN|nr:hypothetical protein TanjilG_03601 [Lupinus angustifolius]
MLEKNSISWNGLLAAYVQNGRVEEGRQLFESKLDWDLISWNCLMGGFVNQKRLARRLFEESPSRDDFTWASMVSGYVQNGMLDEARRVFDEIPEKNENGGIDHARKLFDMMPQHDSVSWAAIIDGYAQNSHYEEALNMFVEMKGDGESLNKVTLSCALSTCANIAALELGEQVHGHAVKTGYEDGCFVGNALLGMYFKLGSIGKAYDVFEGNRSERYCLLEHNTGEHNIFYSMDKDYGVTPTSKHYTCMIDLLGRVGRFEEVLNLTKNMPFEPDGAACGALLGACRIHGNNEVGEKAAEMVFKMVPHNTGLYVLLSNLYATFGRWIGVGKIRSKMKDVGVLKVPGYSWVEIQNKIHKFTVGDCFHPDKARIYAFLEELDLKMKLEGDLSEARRLFEESPSRDVFTWTSMVSGYVHNGMLDEDRRVFDDMPEKNEVSYNSMIAGYCQKGGIDPARKLFDMMPQRDYVSWAAIIAVYAHNSHYEEALNMFVEMKRDAESLNRATFSCALSTCGDIVALDLGKQVHGQAMKTGYETGCFVGNALLGMYFKCGSISEAYDVFEGIEVKDVVSWNTMLAGYARHGFCKQALTVFESMKMAGLRPDEITMDYGVMPTSKHYTCMIDLLGRVVHFEEVLNFMKNMPFEPDGAAWGALLGACQIHGNTELGEKAAEMLFKMEPHNTGMYVLT